MEAHAVPLADVPTKRRIWWMIVTAVLTTLAVIALAAGAYLVYRAKTQEIASLKDERQTLRLSNARLAGELASAQATIERKAARLAKTTVALGRTKKNLTKIRKDVKKLRTDLAAANARAEANYGAGYSAGTNEGYESGRSAGLVQASDDLTCSDDPDVTWLPYCDW